MIAIDARCGSELGNPPPADMVLASSFLEFSQDNSRKTMQTIRRLLAGESGATAIEYGLIAAGIALAIIAVVNNLGSTLNKKFSAIRTSLN
jgi:pilus assembly protein Flp/PilA